MSLKDMFKKKKEVRYEEISSIGIPVVVFGNRYLELIIARWLGIISSDEAVPSYNEVNTSIATEELSKEYKINDQLEKKVRGEVGILLATLGFESNERIIVDRVLQDGGIACYRTGSQEPFIIKLGSISRDYSDSLSVGLQQGDIIKKYLYDYAKKESFLTMLFNEENPTLVSENKSLESHNKLYFEGQIADSDMEITLKTKGYRIRIKAKFYEYDKSILRNLLGKIYQLMASLSYPLPIKELYSKLNGIFPISNDKNYLELIPSIDNFYLNISQLNDDEIEEIETISYTNGSPVKLTCKVEGGTLVAYPEGFKEEKSMVLVSTSGDEEWSYASPTMVVKQDNVGTHFNFIDPEDKKPLLHTITHDLYGKAHEISSHTVKKIEEKRIALLLSAVTKAQ